jgi:hypothetical protein
VRVQVSKARLNRDGGWRLWHYTELLGDFDYLVISHNGKCAARLMKVLEGRREAHTVYTSTHRWSISLCQN